MVVGWRLGELMIEDRGRAHDHTRYR
jgi:hypothetical protein